jgi:hypothetical protein
LHCGRPELPPIKFFSVALNLANKVALGHCDHLGGQAGLEMTLHHLPKVVGRAKFLGARVAAILEPFADLRPHVRELRDEIMRIENCLEALGAEPQQTPLRR